MAQTLRLKRPVITFLLIVILFVLLYVLYALFISGPYRLHEQQQKQTEAIIYEQVPEIRGLQENIFAYVTWQGYTDDQLYWFDVNGALITTRDLATLDYQQAEAIALERYNMEASGIELAFGYSHPVYQLENDRQLLLLDYDTFETVYLRMNVNEEPYG